MMGLFPIRHKLRCHIEAGTAVEISRAPIRSEADLEDLTVVAYEPPGVWIRKSDRPVAAHVGQFEPGTSFIGSPCCLSRVEVRLRLGGNYDGLIVLVIEFAIIAMRIREAQCLAPLFKPVIRVLFKGVCFRCSVAGLPRYQTHYQP